MGINNSKQLSKYQKEGKTDDTEKRDSTDDHTGGNNRPQNTNSYIRNKCTYEKRRLKRLPTNPFIIFFLRLRSKKPKEPVTVIAKIAGKLWGRMSHEKKKRYVELANAEKKRRGERKRKRKRKAVVPRF